MAELRILNRAKGRTESTAKNSTEDGAEKARQRTESRKQAEIIARNRTDS